MVGYIGRVTEVAPEKIGFKVRPSSAGQWEAVSIQAPLANADQLYECYAVLKNDPRVRMAL
ncbi:hypothetical protein M885DRAFT_531834 [Pelagophyceae sp. CCMP2097]|nr:hypothetical protein M885DRAFT_531834 [Pelagophyceae sp. CCMP2097]